MPCKYAWLFNNPQASDMTILISTHTTTSAANCDSGYPTSKSLPGHSVVLGSASEYFRALSSDRWANPPAKKPRSKTRTRDAPSEQTVRLEVPSQDLIPSAELAIKFLYYEELDEQLSIPAVLQVVQLADMYGFTELVEYCGKRLTGLPEDHWSKEEMIQLMDLPHCFMANPPWNALVDRLGELMVSELGSMEKSWNDEYKQQLILLPLQAIKQLLKQDKLEVVTEAVVLCAAVAWLRGPRGVAASPKDRKELFGLVRILRLSSGGKQLLCLLPETKELLPPQITENLVFLMLTASAHGGHLPSYCHKDPRMSSGLVDGSLEHWSKPRKTITSAPTFTGRLNAQQLYQQIARCQKKCYFIEHVFHRDGFDYIPSCTVKSFTAQDSVTSCEITVGGAAIAAIDVGEYCVAPMRIHVSCSGNIETVDRQFDSCSRGLWNAPLFNVADVTKPEESLGLYVVDGHITITYTIKDYEQT